MHFGWCCLTCQVRILAVLVHIEFSCKDVMQLKQDVHEAAKAMVLKQLQRRFRAVSSS
jgi:hypothetical protein